MIDAVVLASCLGLMVAVGIVVHELLHAVVLRSAGVECSLSLFPDGTGTGGFETLVSGSLASVEMASVPSNCSPWHLRLAAMAPLAMLVPVVAYGVLVTVGSLTGSTFGSVVVIAWMACALPSPADFAIVWHTEDALTLAGDD